MLPAASASIAQAPAGSDKLTPAAVAESLTVLRQLDSAVHANPNDAKAWYHRGMVAWALYERDRTQPPISGLDWTMLGHMADTSLRIAAQIDAAYPQYGMMAGRFLLSSGVSIVRVASFGLFDAALEAARAGGDKTTYAEVAVEAGRVYWRRYDALANRWSDITGRPCLSTQVLDGRMFMPTKADSNLPLAGGARIGKALLSEASMPLPFDGAGEADYLKAEELFKEAYHAQPSYERAYRQLAMLLVERSRWTELATLARARLEIAPWDAWAWLTLGLGQHRTGNSRLATAAFDSGLTLLAPEERKRLDRLERILPLGDSTRLLKADESTRAATERLYWLSADPLWSKSGAEPRIEFLSRVTYSELRWTVEEMKARGADTDRGEIHIRFGPPDMVASFGPPPDVCTVWVYNSGFLFQFVGQPTFATAKHGQEEVAAAMIEASAARWDNLALPRIDSMPVQTARFRATADSVDFYFATLAPLDTIRKASEVIGIVRNDYWLLAGGTVSVAHDSVVPAAAGARAFTHRVARGNYVYRTEASSEGSSVAGRASAVVVAGPDAATGFSMTGFGISDVLVTTVTEAQPGTARRWSDLTLTPLVGAIGGNARLALVWENYDFGERNRSAQYTVNVVLDREQSAAGRIAARIVGSVASRMGVEATENRVSMRFDRNVPHAATMLDNIALSLGQTPRGSYRLTVEVTDQVTGKVTARSLRLIIQ
jgi:GWxTD domain-containing protein